MRNQLCVIFIKEVAYVFRNLARNRWRRETDLWFGLVRGIYPSLPEGVGCIPMYAGIKEHSERGYLGAMETYHAKVAELAEIGVDLMHPEGGPPFMVRGHKAEQEIVGGWEAKYKMPIFTSGMSQAEALRALGIKKFVGCTYFSDEKIN